MSATGKKLAPSHSISHKSILAAASTEGHDQEAIRQLFRLINAHPSLVAHARVFANLAECLETRVFSDEFIQEFGAWRHYLPIWKSFCHWAASNAPHLTQLPGLGDFDRQPRHESDHPLLGTGVGKHGVVAALWNRHESAKEQFPPPRVKSPARSYFLLQAQLVLSYIESRWRFCTLEFYETYTGQYESPIAPALSGSATRAIRELSLAKYNHFTENLGAGQPHTGFMAALAQYPGDITDLELADQTRALRALNDLKRYFRGFARVLRGQRPRKLRRDGGGWGGGGSRRPGYIPFRTEGVYFQIPEPEPADDDIPWSSGTAAFIDLNTGLVDEPVELEKSGLAPAETLEEVFKLVDPSELGGALQKLRYQRLAMEMAAQKFPWNWENLIRSELRALSEHLEQSIERYYQNPPNRSAARYQALSALILKLTLLFGISIERAHEISIKHLADRGAWDFRNPPEITGLTLFVYLPTKGAQPEVLGFGIPALSPNYKSELPEGADELSRPTIDTILLPDLSELGEQLMRFRDSEPMQDERLFHIEGPKLKYEIKETISQIPADRITPEKIQRALGVEVLRQTGDLTLSWVVTADFSRQNEPRMFYTQYPIETVRRAYINAASALLKLCRLRFSPPTPDAFSVEDTVSIGARFVLKFDELKQLIEDLQRQLKEARRLPLNNKSIIEYHELFVFYTYIFQSLWTSIRAIVGPTELFNIWQTFDERNIALPASLSDKDSRYFDKARLVWISATLARQYRNYELHEQYLCMRLGLTRSVQDLPPDMRALMLVTDKRTLEPLRPKWIEEMFEKHLGFVPANFHRAFLRTELLARGLAAESIDAFLGHANLGESSFGLYSTFDYGHHLRQLLHELAAIHQKLDLVSIESRLVIFPVRLIDA